MGTSGSTGSRLISGNSKICEKAEDEIAGFFNAESALMFNSGYDANLGFFSTVPQKGDIVLYDEHIHASVRDGLRLGLSKSYSFRHNDVEHLKERLDSLSGDVIYIAVESLYSMNGDLAPLKEINDLASKYGAYLVVDEAHAGGVIGENGVGLSVEQEVAPFARLITFGKAYGSHGGCVLGSKELRSFLINFARSFIYTTALPEFVFEHNAEVVHDPKLEVLKSQLESNIEFFLSHFDYELPSDTRSPIQIIPVGSVEWTSDLAARIREAGIAVKPIYSPTVPEGEECLRVCIHAFNTEEEIRRLAGLILE